MAIGSQSRDELLQERHLIGSWLVGVVFHGFRESHLKCVSICRSYGANPDLGSW